MEEWDSGISTVGDCFLTGLVIGLAISIVLMFTVIVSHDYYTDKKIEAMQESLNAEFEEERLRLEGF